MWRMVKTEFHFFLFFFKVKNDEDIRDWIFRVFLTVYVYSDTKIDQTLTVYRKQSAESKSVEIFGQSETVFELETF